MTSAIPEIQIYEFSQRSWVRIPFKPEFFSGLIFATAQVAYITAMIIHLFIVYKLVGKNTEC